MRIYNYTNPISIFNYTIDKFISPINECNYNILSSIITTIDINNNPIIEYK